MDKEAVAAVMVSRIEQQQHQLHQDYYRCIAKKIVFNFQQFFIVNVFQKNYMGNTYTPNWLFVKIQIELSILVLYLATWVI